MAESIRAGQITTQSSAGTMQGISYQNCPQCGRKIPVYPGYVTWCDHCLWNLAPTQKEEAHNLLGRLYRKLSDRLGQEQFERMERASALRPSVTPSKVAAFVVAGAVHAFTLALFLLGAALVVLTWLNVVAAIIGVLVMAIAWLLRPRLGKIPTNNAAPKQQFPILYALADRVSDGIGAKRVDMIALDDRFDATFSRVGWQRKSVLTIGLPLFVILAHQERVALLAQKIAHDVNGDAMSSFVVGSALQSLNEWYRILHPSKLWEPRAGTQQSIGPSRYEDSRGIIQLIANLIANTLMLVLSLIPRFWLVILSQLNFEDHQRAEYLADNLAARAAGIEGALGLLRKLHMADTVQMEVEHFYLNGSRGDLFSALKARTSSVPQRELDRLDQVEKMQGSLLGPMYPATPYRIELIKARGARMGSVQLSETDNSAIDQEITQVASVYEAELLESPDGSGWDSPQTEQYAAD